MAYTTIKKPSDYFNTVTYTGTAGGQTISGVGHQPDFIWVKQRGDAGYDHSLHNSVSGLLKQLISNSTAAEITNTDTITSNNSDGFVLGADTAGPNANSNNQDTKTYVAWNWKANGTGAANTDGDIASTVSANTTSGFSIVSYTSNGSASQTVGHGLGVAPNVIISKNRTDGGATYGNWVVYHSSLATANDKKILLNSTAASSSTNEWGDTDPTSTVYSVHTSGDGATNHSTDQIVSYCFAEKQGFSKFGTYTGNGNADGAFVYTGFKPAFIMVKVTTTANSYDDWIIYDNKRIGYNVAGNRKIYANASDAEPGDTDLIDLLSNGFKFRNTHSNANGSGQTFIYMAFAEEPLVGDNPATAR